jgi:hypothetical protein
MKQAKKISPISSEFRHFMIQIPLEGKRKGKEKG